MRQSVGYCLAVPTLFTVSAVFLPHSSYNVMRHKPNLFEYLRLVALSPYHLISFHLITQARYLLPIVLSYRVVLGYLVGLIAFDEITLP